jgi:hypothetical protein
MTKTETRRGVALAALLAGTIAGAAAVAQDAHAKIGLNGLDPYGFAEEGGSPDGTGPRGLGPNGGGLDGAKIVPGKTDKPDPTPILKRGSNPKRASDLGGVMVAFPHCPDPRNC